MHLPDENADCGSISPHRRHIRVGRLCLVLQELHNRDRVLSNSRIDNSLLQPKQLFNCLVLQVVFGIISTPGAID